MSQHHTCSLPTSKRASRTLRCMALGCTADLSHAKVYCQRRHLCEDHLAADAVQLPGVPHVLRWCFQCGKLEDLSCFDGTRRTCRARLARRRNSPSSKRHRAGQQRRCHSHPAVNVGAGAQPLSPASLAFGDLLAAGSPLSSISHGGFSSPQEQHWQAAQCSSGQCSAASSGCATAPVLFAAGAPAQQQQQQQQQGQQGTPCFVPAPAGCFFAPPAAPAPAATPAAAGSEYLLPADDAVSLRIMLETELTAAALEATLASCSSGAGGSALPSTDSNQLLSRQLAEVLVDSDPTQGLLFGGAADLGFGSLSSGTGCMLPAAPVAAAQPYPLLSHWQGRSVAAPLMSQNSCSGSTCSGPCLPGWAGTAGMMMPLGAVAAPAAGAGYMPAAGMAAPAASSTAGCYSPAPGNTVLAATRPGARMPVFAQGAVAPVAPVSPVFPPPVAWITAASAGLSPAAEEARCGSQEDRLQQLKRQAVSLHAQVEAMRSQLGGSRPSCHGVLAPCW